METMTQDRLVGHIHAATTEVFATMLGAEVQPGETRRSRSEPEAAGGVVSFIGLAGSWAGTGGLSCTSEMACRISGMLLLAEYAAVNEDVLDAVAEVTNMIIGNVKTALEAELGPMGLSIPTVIFGRNFATRTSGSDEWTTTSFTCGGGSLEVRICLSPSRQHRPAGRVTHTAPRPVMSWTHD